MAIAIHDEKIDIFLGKSGALEIFPNRLDKLLIVPALILIAIMVPIEYANKKNVADRQDVIAIAGAILGAPSQENPCNNPFAKIAPFDIPLPDASSIFSSAEVSRLSLRPNKPINNKLTPTADSVKLDSLLVNLPPILSFKKKAQKPIKVAETP